MAGPAIFRRAFNYRSPHGNAHAEVIMNKHRRQLVRLYRSLPVRKRCILRPLFRTQPLYQVTFLALHKWVFRTLWTGTALLLYYLNALEQIKKVVKKAGTVLLLYYFNIPEQIDKAVKKVKKMLNGRWLRKWKTMRNRRLSGQTKVNLEMSQEAKAALFA